MNDEKQLKDKEDGSVNLGRHQAQCSICLSSYRQQIDELFVDWASPSLIAEQYNGLSRDSLYRHAHACDLFSKRKKNIGMALEKIIERVDNLPMAGSQVVSAIQTYVKLNSPGKGTEWAKGTNPKELFERMSKEEREGFARDGSLPDWFSNGIGATLSDSQEGEKESQVTETKRLQ
ncbi:MAG: hypothetical protein ABSH01_12780 [Terriglobia bacterium]|jgi:hypothetical protein